MRSWLVRLGGLFGRTLRDGEFAAELDAHVQAHVDDNVRAGMTPDEARRTALLVLAEYT